MVYPASSISNSMREGYRQLSGATMIFWPEGLSTSYENSMFIHASFYEIGPSYVAECGDLPADILRSNIFFADRPE